jgi:hypothetical protein
MTSPGETGPLRPTTPGVRWLLLAGAVLAGVAGIELFILTNHTDTFFAWTIDSAMTAAFLGACYLGAVPLVVLCARQPLWAHARLGVPGVFALLVVLLVVTLRHIDRFHMDAITGWQWLAVYSLLPVITVFVVRNQLRVAGGDPPRRFPIPDWVRAALWGQAVVMALAGAALLLFPGETSDLWPWPLTTLTARAIGGWLVTLAVATVHSTLENDWPRLHAPFVAYVALALLQFVALARYGSELAWDRPRAWIFVAFVAGVLAIGLYGWAQARSALAGLQPEARR